MTTTLIQNAADLNTLHQFFTVKSYKYWYLHKYLSFHLQIGDKICNFVALYESPSQSQDNFEEFADNFEITLKILAQKNSFLITANGDFNSKSTNWWNKDKTNFEDNTQLEI